MNKKAKHQLEAAQVKIVEIESVQIESSDEPTLDGDGQVRGTVAMSRALVNAQQGLTLNENRVMMAALRCVDSKKSPYLHSKGTGYVSVRVRADEFAALAALAPRSGEKQATAAYEGLKEGCASLQKRQLTYMDGPKKVVLNWVWKAVYHEREGWAEIFIFAGSVASYLHAAKAVCLVPT